MTREQAIELIDFDRRLCNRADELGRENGEALDMAIEALELVTSYEDTINKLTEAIANMALVQEPCEDCISREETEKLLKCGCAYAIYDLPSVKPKALEQEPCDYYDTEIKTCRRSEVPPETEWIPVSERLPNKLKDVLIAFEDCPNEYDVAYLRTTFNKSYKKNGAKNEWVSSMGEATYADYEVSAWMLIEPYKAESEE